MVGDNDDCFWAKWIITYICHLESDWQAFSRSGCHAYGTIFDILCPTPVPVQRESPPSVVILDILHS